jgi:NADH:ubiquinone reductase (H+-translocating)
MNPNKTGEAVHRIGVVGGGAGGLEFATKLGNKLGRKGRAYITLIDKARTHFWKPPLREIAAGSFDVNVHATDPLAGGREFSNMHTCWAAQCREK